MFEAACPAAAPFFETLLPRLALPPVSAAGKIGLSTAAATRFSRAVSASVSLPLLKTALPPMLALVLSLISDSGSSLALVSPGLQTPATTLAANDPSIGLSCHVLGKCSRASLIFLCHFSPH